LRALNWIGPGAIEDLASDGHELFVQVRSSRPPVPGYLYVGDAETFVEFASDEDAVSPGQACVFYESDQPRARVLGGGIISSTEPACPAVAKISHQAELEHFSALAEDRSSSDGARAKP
jgi:tRNA-specific 2-thiouridylase